MDRLQGSRITGGNTNYGRAKSDLYPTPPEATQALLNFLELPQTTTIWEPACGQGHMVKVLQNNGFAVIGTDIESGTDFLGVDIPNGIDWIITNPPFSKAEEFIRRCFQHRVPFALLLKAHYWNAKRRISLFRECQPKYVLPLTWRPDFMFGARGSGSPLLDVSWVVWGSKSSEVTKFLPLERPINIREGDGA